MEDHGDCMGSVAKQSSSHGRRYRLFFLIVSSIGFSQSHLSVFGMKEHIAFLFLSWKVELIGFITGFFMPSKPDALPLSRFPFISLGGRAFASWLD